MQSTENIDRVVREDDRKEKTVTKVWVSHLWPQAADASFCGITLGTSLEQIPQGKSQVKDIYQDRQEGTTVVSASALTDPAPCTEKGSLKSKEKEQTFILTLILPLHREHFQAKCRSDLRKWGEFFQLDKKSKFKIWVDFLTTKYETVLIPKWDGKIYEICLRNLLRQGQEEPTEFRILEGLNEYYFIIAPHQVQLI